MKIKQIWEVRYKINPTLSKTEEFGGYSFEVNNGSSYTTKIYEVNVLLNEKRIKSKLVKKAPPQIQIIKDQQDIRNILLKRMIFTGSFSEISIEPETSLKNQQELEEDGFRLTTPLRANFIQSYSILDVENSYLSTCENFWSSGFQGTFSGLEEEILFISDWIEKSVVEEQAIQSFMLLWVAFNCIYDTFSGKSDLINSGDSFTKIEKSISKLLDSTDVTNILKNFKSQLYALVSYELIVPPRKGQKKSTPISYQLGRMIEEDAPPHKIICKAMRCLYEIRNNLFHQGSINTNIEPQADVAKTFLLPVTTKMLRNMVNH